MSKRYRVGDKVELQLPGRKQETFVIGPDIDLDKEVVLDGNGERLTEARAQELAEEIMQEYYRGVGRPTLAGTSKGKHSPHVSFRVPEHLAERTEALASREGKSLSQIGREALEQYLDRAG